MSPALLPTPDSGATSRLGRASHPGRSLDCSRRLYLNSQPIDPSALKEGTPDEFFGGFNEAERRHLPKRLWLLGRGELLTERIGVAIVGSRQASAPGLARAARLAKELTEKSYAVISGLALGVDTAAHQAAIDAGGETIAVLGTPVDACYPRANLGLQRRIAEQHLLVSQFPPGSPVQRKNFVLRNRTMALLAHASVIVEAGDGSGTLHQGWEALRLGRPLFLMRSVVDNPSLFWPAEMLNHGAYVLETTEDLLEHLPSTPRGFSVDELF
jgi:DNA processing protein